MNIFSRLKNKSAVITSPVAMLNINFMRISNYKNRIIFINKIQKLGNQHKAANICSIIIIIYNRRSHGSFGPDYKINIRRKRLSFFCQMNQLFYISRIFFNSIFPGTFIILYCSNTYSFFILIF